MDPQVPGTGTQPPQDLSTIIPQLLATLAALKPQDDINQATPAERAAGEAAAKLPPAQMPNTVPIAGEVPAKGAEAPKNSAIQNIMAFIGQPDAKAPQVGDQGGIGHAISAGKNILSILGIL